MKILASLLLVIQSMAYAVSSEAAKQSTAGTSSAGTASNEGTLALSDGRVFNQARIVTIGKTEVAILHSGGLANVPIDVVPLDVLARAHIASEEAAARRKEATEKATAKYADAEPTPGKQVSGEPSTKGGKNSREQVNRFASSPPPAKSQPVVNVEQRLSTLKARFPKKERISVPITNKRGSRNNVVATATTRTTQNILGSTSETTISAPRRGADAPTDVIEVEVPHSDLYANYQGWVRVATSQSLPKVIQRIEERIESDLIELRRQQNSISSQSGSAQAKLTEQWIQSRLRPYLAELKQLR